MKKLNVFLLTMFVFGTIITVLHGQIIVGNYTATSFQSGATLPSSCNGSSVYSLTTTKVPYYCNNGVYAAFSSGSSALEAIPIASLPTAVSVGAHVLQAINNGISGTDCTVGGGTNTVWCVSNGTIWVAISSGISSGLSGGSAGAQPYQTAASTTAFVYPATDVNALNLDGNRTDSYTPDGTPERPYKTLAQLITGAASVTGPYVIACNPTTAQYTYTGNVTFPAYQGTIIGNSCMWNITGNVTVPGTYYISNLYTYITGSLAYTSTASYEKVRIGGSLVVSGGITTSGYDHFFDMSILSNTVINVAASSTPVFTNVVGTPLIKTASGSTAATIVTIIDSQSLASGAYTNVDLSNGGLLIARGYLATNSGTLANIILSGSSGSSTSVANELSGVGAAWVAAGSSYTYLDNSSLIALLTGSNLLTPSGLGMQAPAANTVTVKSGTTGAATFDSGTTGAVNVGTGANAKTVTIGNTTGATAVNINAGTGGINMTGVVVGSNDSSITSNFSTTSTTMVPTGISISIPSSATARVWRVECAGSWTNASTSVTSNIYAVSSATPTALNVVGFYVTSSTMTPIGSLFTTTGSTSVTAVSASPSTASNYYPFKFEVSLSMPSSTPTTLTLQALTSSASYAAYVGAYSGCTLLP
jgi:hypothetical protein